MFKQDLTRLFAAVLICTSIFGLSDYGIFETEVSAIEETEAVFGWYTKPSKDGVRPPLPSEASFIEKYDACYIGRDEKVIYLTFDAGYSNENLIKVLDVLKEKDVKASFFLNGGIFKYESDAVKRIHGDGHLVCNHTENHKNMSNVSDFETYKYEVEKVAERFRELTGDEMGRFLRPPMGEFNEKSLEYNKQLGYKTVFWSLAYADWDNNKQPDCEKAFNTVMERTHNGAIILLHPTSATNAKILGRLIDAWREQGYSFETLETL